MMNFDAYMRSCQESINERLRDMIGPSENGADRLREAMVYSLVNGGKRVRPVLVYAAAAAVGANAEAAVYPAAAIEMIHAYSLVHDDLPAMDDDDLRRGQATCHIAYDEATAILAGDALQTEAFSVLSKENVLLSPQQQLRMIQILATASGAEGMAAGQSIDLTAVGAEVGLEYLENMHNHKTGALIKAAVLMGAHCRDQVDSTSINGLIQYSQAIGLAFQVQDDILDVISDTHTLGKTQGADAALNKPTYVSLLGLDGAQKKASELHLQAVEALTVFDDNAKWLRALADYIVDRNY